MSSDNLTPRETIKQYSQLIITNLQDMIKITKDNINEKGVYGTSVEYINNLIDNANKVIEETRKNMKNEKDLTKLQHYLVPLIETYDKLSFEIPTKMNDLKSKFDEIKGKISDKVEEVRKQISDIANEVHTAAINTFKKSEDLDNEYGITSIFY